MFTIHTNIQSTYKCTHMQTHRHIYTYTYTQIHAVVKDTLVFT